MLEGILCVFDVNDFQLLNKVVYSLWRLSNKNIVSHKKVIYLKTRHVLKSCNIYLII